MMRMTPPTSLAARKQRRAAAARSGPPQPLPLDANIGGKARQSESRHIMLSKAAAHRLRRLGVRESARSQTVKSKDGLVVRVVDREESFRASEFMALTRVPLQKLVHGSI